MKITAKQAKELGIPVPPKRTRSVPKPEKVLSGPRVSSLTVTLPWPPSVNHYWRHSNGIFHVSKEGKAYRKIVASTCYGRGHIEGSVVMEILAYPPDERTRDLDNLLKATLDSLAHAGVYGDDSQIDRLCIDRMRATAMLRGKIIVYISGTGA